MQIGLLACLQRGWDAVNCLVLQDFYLSFREFSTDSYLKTNGSGSCCLVEQEYWDELSTVHATGLRVQRTLCVKWGSGYGCQWRAIGRWAAWTSSCLLQFPAYIHHLQDVIILLKTALVWSLGDMLLCNDKPARRSLIIHSCVIVEYCQSVFFKGKSPNSSSLQIYFPLRT